MWDYVEHMRLSSAKPTPVNCLYILRMRVSISRFYRFFRPCLGLCEDMSVEILQYNAEHEYGKRFTLEHLSIDLSILLIFLSYSPGVSDGMPTGVLVSAKITTILDYSIDLLNLTDFSFLAKSCLMGLSDALSTNMTGIVGAVSIHRFSSFFRCCAGTDKNAFNWVLGTCCRNCHPQRESGVTSVTRSPKTDK
ncbi:hypothetical protein Y032_0171g334 [Ancylostoma ceylanicum]|uniref:Uncharacterized protein n=1 Tax=Ancylostoma ceylanicum TaxID=53326 RepID=A0A016SVU3_9BILA|nr:hypothetical protein Y032_0171g334 [Ancylostoma ceylanicum]